VSDRSLAGKFVVVVGGGRGIGRAHALACAAEGASLLVNDLGCDLEGKGEDPSIAEGVAREIRERGGLVLHDTTDVAGAAGAERVIELALQNFGRIDAVIAAAGISVDRTALKMEDALLDRMIDVHVRGSFALVRAASRAMVDAGVRGSIVLHTAPVSFFGALRQSALAACGAAVAGLVRSSAIELRKHKIRINAIAPTARTRATEDLALFRGIAEGSMGPEFVGPVGAFLCSDLASEISGEIVGVAGSRLYTLRSRETPGWFGDATPPSPAAIAGAWPEIERS
jgi:NAD(P)-dependent dehydrogenase (short-subunit alcohol dehydrogenase family)